MVSDLYYTRTQIVLFPLFGPVGLSLSEESAENVSNIRKRQTSSSELKRKSLDEKKSYEGTSLANWSRVFWFVGFRFNSGHRELS